MRRHIGICTVWFAFAIAHADGAAILFRLGEPVIQLGPGTAQAINNNNQVVINSDNRTLVYTPNQGLADIGSLGGGRTWGTAINDAGMVVGSSYTAGGIEHAFLWTPGGGMLDLGVYGTASGINNSGLIVGYQWTPGTINPVSSFFWSQSTGLSPVGSPFPNTWMFAVNNNGQAAGSAFGPGGYTAFLYSSSTGFVNLDLSPWAFRRPYAISESGVIAGQVNMNPGDDRAFVWSPSTGAFIFPAGYIEATAVNDRAGVVGTRSSGGGFLRTPDGALYAFPEIRPNGINNAGYIVGFLDTPEPGSLGLLALSGCGLICWNSLGKRRRYRSVRGSGHILNA